MGYKYIKCHKCYGRGCAYCGLTGSVTKDKGNKILIDKYYDSLNLDKKEKEYLKFKKKLF